MQNVNENESEIVSVDNNQYIETIKKMKDTMVDKEDYDKLKAENKHLLEVVINGEDDMNTSSDVKETIDINALRDSLFNGENTNLDYVSKSLTLRDELIAQGKPDPFLPIGHAYTPDDNDVKSAERVANKLKELVEEANGDSAFFTARLQQELVEVVPNKNIKNNLRR